MKALKTVFEIRTPALGHRHSLRLAALVFSAGMAASASHWDGSRTPPVHRIPLTDEDRRAIVSSVPDSMPFSTRTTCGACHDYNAIHGGTHFLGAGQGRPTEPWIVVSERSGTQVPADRLNLSAWEFTRRFGSHLPGGAISDPADKLADPAARWDISGGLEMNCLACHNLSPRQDMTEWAKQIGRENFRWAATAAAGIGEVGGMCSRLPDWWNVYVGENPDDQVYAVPPSVDYDLSLFDSKHRIWFEIGMPQDRNCLQCHSFHPVGKTSIEVPGDVHAAAGLSCVDCHRNGIDHQMLRGTTGSMSCESCHIADGATAGEHGAPLAHHKGLPPVHFEKMTCTACHSGTEPFTGPHPVRTSRANRLGIHGRAQWFTEAPFVVEPVFVRNPDGRIEPRRMMWPAFWAAADGQPLDTAAVETAAAGILDADRQIGAILTALAAVPDAPGEPVFATGGRLYRLTADGGLSVAGTADAPLAWGWKTPTNLVSALPDFDVNAEPIDADAEGRILAVMTALAPRETIAVVKGRMFTRGADGFLAGTNTALAAGWYLSSGEPLVAPFAERAVADTVGTGFCFNEEQVALMLKKLGGDACYMASGRKFALSGDGTLTDEDHAAAAPVSWAIGHDVRGTAQSLGAKKCAECHSANSRFFFGAVAATGPLKTDRAQVRPMHAFQQVDPGFSRLFGASFNVRKCFKTVLASFAALLGLIALAVGLPALYRLTTRFGEIEAPVKPLQLTLFACLGILAVTGFVFGWPVSYPLNGFPLLCHVGCGAFYSAVLCAWALLRARSGSSVCFWTMVVCGVILILSVVLAMFPFFGTHGQHVCIQIHRFAAILTIVAAATGCLISKKHGG